MIGQKYTVMYFSDPPCINALMFMYKVINNYMQLLKNNSTSTPAINSGGRPYMISIITNMTLSYIILRYNDQDLRIARRTCYQNVAQLIRIAAYHFVIDLDYKRVVIERYSRYFNEWVEINNPTIQAKQGEIFKIKCLDEL